MTCKHTESPVELLTNQINFLEVKLGAAARGLYVSWPTPDPEVFVMVPVLDDEKAKAREVPSQGSDG